MPASDQAQSHNIRTSLYAAFGDKAGMFEAALAAYRDLAAARLAAALNTSGPVAAALEAAFAEALDVYGAGGNAPRGCFAMTSLPVEAGNDPRWRSALAVMIGLTDALFATRLRAAVAAGELAQSLDCDMLGTLLSSLLHSLALRSRAGFGRDQLLALARAGIASALQQRLPGKGGDGAGGEHHAQPAIPAGQGA